MPQPDPRAPFCIIGKCTWGVVQALKIPESQIPLYVGTHGWMVLIRDSEMPEGYLEPPTRGWFPTQSHPSRAEYPHEDDGA